MSGYATASFSEYVAESFASYRKGEKLTDPELAKVFEGLKTGNVSKPSPSNQSGFSFIRRIKELDITKTIRLEKKEYGRVMSELNTYLNIGECRGKIISKCIGDYQYTFEVIDFDEYRFVCKERLW